MSIDANKMMTGLNRQRIGSRPFFCPMHQQPVLLNMGLFKDEKYPVAEKLYRQGFYIPSGMALTDEQITRVSTTVREVVQ